ncbi:MAG: hypothetical protein ABIJ91_04975 [Candidatus Kuenenbacteria bacterium]
MFNYKKIVLPILLLTMALNFVPVSLPQAQANGFDLNTNVSEQLEDIKDIGLPGRDKAEGRILEVVTDVIKMVLSLLALIFLILIIVAGVKWMTAAGNEESITKAKKIISNALIGLLIIFLSYAITAFVFGVVLKPK